MTQQEAVFNYLKNFGPISPLKAQSEFGVWRLSSIIHRLRNKGHRIITINRRTFSNKQFAEYRLIS
jgi:hypothetical protein